MPDFGDGDRPTAHGGPTASQARPMVVDRRRFAEDFVVGELFDLGSHAFDEAAVVGFARRYDPQPFHLDHDAGAASMLGGLAASGWQLVAVLNRAFADAVLAGAHHRGLVEVDRVRWMRPVLAGTRIAAVARVAAIENRDAGAAAATALLRCVVSARDEAGRTAVEIVRCDRIARFGAAA